MKKIFLVYLLSILSLSLYAEKVNLIYDNSTEWVDVGDEFLMSYGSKVTEIKFESENPDIRKIVLEGNAFLKDYSFIAECKNLQVLVINDASVKDFSFLENCRSLKIIAFDSVKFEKMVDLRKLENLEYIAFTNCALSEFSNIKNHAKKLKYVNLSYNKISRVPNFNFNDKALYFLAGNNILSSSCKNCVFDTDVNKYLSDEFKAYVR